MTIPTPPEGLEPGDITYPYVDPVVNDGEIPPDTPVEIVPPFDPDAPVEPPVEPPPPPPPEEPAADD